MGFIFRLVVGYLLACPLSSLVSLDMTQTAWGNILTYIWILGAFTIWSIIFTLAIFCVAAIAAK